jgi:hypothetical protein
MDKNAGLKATRSAKLDGSGAEEPSASNMPPVDAMRTSLGHVPVGKHAELARLAEILFEEFRTALGTHPLAASKPAE